MLKQLWHKIKESLVSILPVTIIVILLNFTPLIDLTGYEVLVFSICAILLIIGMSLFNLGADLSMQPMGEQVGSALIKSKKIAIIVLVCFMMGLLITIAEPDLTVLGKLVESVISSKLLIIFVGLGVGIFLVISVMKIIFKKDLSLILMFFYMLMFALSCLVIISGNEGFLALSYDSGGVTTGPITVPFIMALGVGIATTIGGRNASENSFGLISLCSIGPILAVLLLGSTIKGEISYQVPDYAIDPNFIKSMFTTLMHTSEEVIIALSLIIGFYLIIQFIYIKLSKLKLIQIGIGILYTFVGLVIFLSAVSVGFMPIGYKMGTQIAQNPVLMVVFGFVLGFVVVLAEPAVHVLKKQVERVTNGGVSQKSMLIALTVGVGISIGLSMVRIICDFSILYYIIPGYFISLGLSLFVPKLYTAIAFDSGGVASGPLTSSFILPFAVGACIILQGESKVMIDAFGIVAMVAMTPLITIQLLGFKAIISKRVKEQARMKKILDATDEQIINFM